MYRKEIYLKRLQAELKNIMQNHDRGCLTITHQNNPFFYPAYILLGFPNQLAAQLINKTEKSQLEYVYLIVALKITSQSYHPQLSEFKIAYPQHNSLANIDRLVDYFTNTPMAPAPKQTKQHLRRQFQKLIGKAEFEGYFRISEVPAYLICTHWLQKFYSSELAHPGPINNQILLEQAEFPLAEGNYSHYNYRVRPDVRQNQDYKVLPYQAWQMLFENYGGVEVKRFTTKEKKPTVQIWYVRTNIWVVEERSALVKVELLISKNDTIQQIINRLKVTLKKYQAVPESYLARQPTVLKASGLDYDQFLALLHNQAKSHLLAQRMEKIQDHTIQLEDVSIYSNHQAIVVNFNRGSSSVFNNVPFLKVIELKQKCLHCGTTDNLELCKCKTVFFCSKICKQTKKEHLKQCSSLQGEARKYTAVTQLFQVARRSHPNLGSLIPLGKVGLENLGNTCYMSSALQCVLRLEPLSKYFLANQHLKDLNVGNVLGSEGYLACAFGQLVKSFYTTSRRSLEPSPVLRVIAKNPQFRGYNHQDSQQFLNYFLDKLHEDLNVIREKPYTQQIESNGRSDEVVSQQSWQNYKKRNLSLVVDNLAGQYRSQIRCPDCQRLSITFDPFLSLTLQFPRPQKGTVVSGFIMSEEGQFMDFSIQVRSSMKTHQFFQKYFHSRVQMVYQTQKKITSIWNPTKTVFQNMKEAGMIFAFQKPLGHAIQIQFSITIPSNKVRQKYVRIVFAKDVIGVDELMRLAFIAIRKPMEKALGKDQNSEEYIQWCRQLDFLKITSVEKQPNNKPFYPLIGATLVRVTLQLDQSKLNLHTAVKLDMKGSKYEGKTDVLIRKVGKQLSISQLLSCFSQPERLTQDNAWYCNVCKDHKLANKIMQLYRVPKILVVHLKRFNHRGDSGNRFIIYGEKVHTPIALEEFQIIKGKRYELIGLVNHIGSLMYGHYTAMVKRDEWFNYDDSRCNRTRLDGGNAYLLFYQQVQ